MDRLGDLQDSIVQIQRELFFPPQTHAVWYSIFDFVQGSHFIYLHFCGDLDHAYSTVGEEAGILVRRCKSLSMTKTNSSREPACRLTDEYRQALCWACYS